MKKEKQSALSVIPTKLKSKSKIKIITKLLYTHLVTLLGKRNRETLLETDAE